VRNIGIFIALTDGILMGDQEDFGIYAYDGFMRVKKKNMEGIRGRLSWYFWRKAQRTEIQSSGILAGSDKYIYFYFNNCE